MVNFMAQQVTAGNRSNRCVWLVSVSWSWASPIWDSPGSAVCVHGYGYSENGVPEKGGGVSLGKAK